MHFFERVLAAQRDSRDGEGIEEPQRLIFDRRNRPARDGYGEQEHVERDVYYACELDLVRSHVQRPGRRWIHGAPCEAHQCKGQDAHPDGLVEWHQTVTGFREPPLHGDAGDNDPVETAAHHAVLAFRVENGHEAMRHLVGVSWHRGWCSGTYAVARMESWSRLLAARRWRRIGGLRALGAA